MSKPYPVLVKWHDAHAMFSGWTSIDDTDDSPYVVESVGWLLPNAKAGHTVIALNKGADVVGDGIAIPNAMIVSVQRLSKKSK